MSMSISFKQIFILYVCFLINNVVVNGESIAMCGMFDPETANGAEGYFQMVYSRGKAEYSFDLDLSSFNFDNAGLNGLESCNVENGLSWHIHTYWTSSTSTSAAGPDGCTSTSGHYDPNLACGPKSESAGTLCKDLGRTSDQGYTYSCASETYAIGAYDLCEMGDLSGKFGKANETKRGSLHFSHTGSYTDYYPPYYLNRISPDIITSQWTSIVFHCGDESGTRLVCASISPLPKGDLKCSPEIETYDNYSYVDYVMVIVSIVTVLYGIYFKYNGLHTRTPPGNDRESSFARDVKESKPLVA